MDPIKKFEELENKNNDLFEGLFSKGTGYAKPDLRRVISEDGQSGLYVNNGRWVNHIKRYKSVPGIFIEYSDEIWRDGALKWLYDARFTADFVDFEGIEPEQITFTGVWEWGEFIGKTFSNSAGRVSYFVNGTFRGKSYAGSNMGFGHDQSGQKTLGANSFIDGIFWDNENGILGTTNLDYAENYDEIELIRIPVGATVVINKGMGSEEQVFVLQKRLNEKSSDFVFYKPISRESFRIPWSTIRESYDSVGYLKRGSGYALQGNGGIVVKTPLIQTLSLLKHYDVQTLSRTFVIDGTRDPRLQKIGIKFAFEIKAISERAISEITDILRDIESGEFFEKLYDIKKAIELKEITGYQNFKDLAPLFNDNPGAGAISPANQALLAYLSKIKKYLIDMSSPAVLEEVVNRASKKVFKSIKKYLGIDNYIHTPYTNQPQAGVQPTPAVLDAQAMVQRLGDILGKK